MSRTVLLGDIATYITEKVSVSDVRLLDYISTENLIADKGGITLATNLPKAGKVTKFRAGDVLVSNIRPYFKKIWQADREGGASNDVLVLRTKTKEVSHNYLYYILKNDRFFDFSTSSSSGSKMPRGDKVQIMKYPVYIPNIETQKKIVDILVTIDEKIMLNRKMNQTLEQTGQALFRHYFIENPQAEKWETGTADNLFELTMGFSPKGESYNDVGSGVALLNGAADFTGASITPKRHTSAPTRVSNPGDIIFCIRGTIGNVCIGYENYCLGRGVAAMAPKENCTSYVYFSTIRAIDDMESAASGSVIRGLSKDDIAKRKIKLPTIGLLEEFENQALPLVEKSRVNSEEIQTLTAIRDTLLPRLISGKIKL